MAKPKTLARYQPILFPPESSWRPPRMEELPTDWNVVRRIGLDTETCDPTLKQMGPGVRRGAFVAGISFALQGQGRGWYLPLRHDGGDNMEDPARAVSYVREQAARFTGDVVGSNISYDIDFLAEIGIEFPLATIRDTSVAEPLLDELQYQYGLDAVLERRGLPLKDERLLREAAAAFGLDAKKDLWAMPARYVGPYAEADATRPMDLLAVQEPLMWADGLQRVWELECAVTPILVKMRRRGVRVDFDRLDRIDRWAAAEELKAWGDLQKLTGYAVSVGQAMQADVLARALGKVDIICPSTATGKPSITKGWLAELKHPAGKVIRRARQMSQLRSTFVNSIREHAVKGRIHTTFRQLIAQKDGEDSNSDETSGAAYGRLSSENPNMQQQPARDPELGPMWRAIYRPDEGAIWCQEDYSQQEPCFALHFAVASGPGAGSAYIGARPHQSAMEAAHRKRSDPTMDYHTMFTSMVHGDYVLSLDKKSKELKALRDPAKNIFLGICYGEGGAKMCHELGWPTAFKTDDRSGKTFEVAGEQGAALLRLIDERVPYVRATAKTVEKLAKARGWVKTILGRRCHFEQDAQGNYDYTYKAFNRVIQGSAADQTKTAMVELDRAGAYLQLQVHDEFDLSVSSEEEGRRYAKIMEDCMTLNVPSRVDAGFGPSWGEVVE